MQVAKRNSIKGVVLRLVVVLALFAAISGLWVTAAPISFWSFFTPNYAGQSLQVKQAYEQAIAGDITLIDIRRPDEWKQTGMGVGAKPLDMRRDDFIAQLDRLLDGDRSQPVALICARGVRSAGMSKRLSAAGFTQIIDVPEGMLGSRAGPGWLNSQLPTLDYKEISQ